MDSLRAAAIALLIWFSAEPVDGAPITIADHFFRTGQTESLVAPFTVFGGTTTTQQWSGLVEVEVSGFGFSTPGSLTDALGPGASPLFHGLRGQPRMRRTANRGLYHLRRG